MLARSLVIVAMIVALAGALLHAAALLARARVERAHERAASLAFDASLAQTKAAIAGALARGADPRALAVTLPPGAVAVPLVDDARDLQSNDAVDEGRYAVRIRDGTRDRYAIFRVFRTPPYAMLAGIRDGTAAPQTGDDAGAESTRVSVRYVDAVSGASFAGDAWDAATADAAATSPPWDP